VASQEEEARIHSQIMAPMILIAYMPKRLDLLRHAALGGTKKSRVAPASPSSTHIRKPPRLPQHVPFRRHIHPVLDERLTADLALQAAAQ